MPRKGEHPVEDAIYEYLVAYNSIYKKLPSNKELAFQFGMDTRNFNKHMVSLMEQGKIERIYDNPIYKLKE